MAEYRFVRFEDLSFEEPLKRRYRDFRSRKGFGWAGLRDLFLLILVLIGVGIILGIVILTLTAILFAAPFFIVGAAILRRVAPQQKVQRYHQPPTHGPEQGTIIEGEVDRS